MRDCVINLHPQAIMEHLLPSLQHVISHCFFTESVHQRSASAQVGRFADI